MCQAGGGQRESEKVITEEGDGEMDVDTAWRSGGPGENPALQG